MMAETEHAQARHVPVTGHVWLNGQGRPMASLMFPDGSKAILAIPHRDRAGDPESSQAYRAAIAALASVPASGDASAEPA
jgi:hypothetical protein